MGEAIGQVLPYGVAVALSAFPIIGVVLMLATPKARANGPALLLGWALGLALVGTIVLLVSGGAGPGAGLSSDMVVNGSLSKTAVNWSAGARTQLSGILVAALTVITLLFLTGLFEQLPEGVPAGW